VAIDDDTLKQERFMPGITMQFVCACVFRQKGAMAKLRVYYYYYYFES